MSSLSARKVLLVGNERDGWPLPLYLGEVGDLSLAGTATDSC